MVAFCHRSTPAEERRGYARRLRLLTLVARNQSEPGAVSMGPVWTSIRMSRFAKSFIGNTNRTSAVFRRLWHEDFFLLLSNPLQLWRRTESSHINPVCFASITGSDIPSKSSIDFGEPNWTSTSTAYLRFFVPTILTKQDDATSVFTRSWWAIFSFVVSPIQLLLPMKHWIVRAEGLRKEPRYPTSISFVLASRDSSSKKAGVLIIAKARPSFSFSNSTIMKVTR